MTTMFVFDAWLVGGIWLLEGSQVFRDCVAECQRVWCWLLQGPLHHHLWSHFNTETIGNLKVTHCFPWQKSAWHRMRRMCWFPPHQMSCRAPVNQVVALTSWTKASWLVSVPQGSIGFSIPWFHFDELVADLTEQLRIFCLVIIPKVLICSTLLAPQFTTNALHIWCPFGSLSWQFASHGVRVHWAVLGSPLCIVFFVQS